MKKNNNILIIAGIVLALGSFYLINRRKKSKEEPSNTIVGKGEVIAEPPLVTIDKSGVNIYSDLSGRIGKITRYSKTPNEKAGKFIGYRTINQSVYVVFSDIYNNGVKSLVLKALTNYKNK